MKRPVAFDLSRMFVGAAARTPRGIDRIDMGYARQFFAGEEGANVGLVPSLGRMGVLPAGAARRLAGIADARWREGNAVGADPAHARLQRWLSGAPETRLPVAPRAGGGVGPTYLRLLAAAARSPWHPAATAVPRDSLYVNIGQVLLGWPWFFAWLQARPDVKVVLMMHDIIPLLYPEYSGPVLSRHHARAVETVVRRASAMIATSHASANELREAAARRGRADLPIHVTPLPVDDSFRRLAPSPGAPGPAYLVAVGIMDQRKNHALLLHVWRDMLRRGDAPIPRLVIAGSRGLRTSELRDLVARAPGLGAHVIVASGLSSPALRDVVRGAAAVLMPSFTEGFGLPVVEALAVGTPVIASDIPAHREVGGALAQYLDPLDGLGWREAILALAREPAAARAARRAALAGYRPQTWSDYFGDVLPFLESL